LTTPSLPAGSVPAGWGAPLYAKLDAELAHAMMGINAVKGVEIGDGFEVAGRRGSAAHDPIVWDAEAGKRRVVPMRWGFPDPKDWRRPRPIHARAETVEIKEPFRKPFHDGQRGIVLFRTFNEGEEVFKPSGRPETRQWTIDPQDDRPRGFAFVWRRYSIEGQPAPLLLNSPAKTKFAPDWSQHSLQRLKRLTPTERVSAFLPL
jgi:putative SOS response-associated peptidase YedK